MTRTINLHVITKELRTKFLSYHAEIGFIYCEQPMEIIKESKSPSRSPQSHDHLKAKIILKSRAFQIKSVNISISIPKWVVGFQLNTFLFLDMFCISN